ncbi:MAG: ribosome-recycling factor [Candidatus Liptonbacteria bacterium]|nr:ribosome-recycling factor [Candidatus Liptonbacteria bacterium]
MNTDALLKTFEQELRGVSDKLKEVLRLIRSNRPSVDLVGDLKVNYYDQWFTIKQLGTLSVLPPRGIQVTLWDKAAVGPVTKAIEEAKAGLTVSSEGLTIRANLSALSNERREELAKIVKKEVEEARIRVRAYRDEANKKLKTAETESQISKDVAFKTKEKLQKVVEDTNRNLEASLEGKLKELEE